jgi:hypothetical protein
MAKRVPEIRFIATKRPALEKSRATRQLGARRLSVANCDLVRVKAQEKIRRTHERRSEVYFRSNSLIFGKYYGFKIKIAIAYV